MILDRTSLFSEGQAITTTTASTNVVDLGQSGTPYGAPAALNRDVARGTDVPMLVAVTEAFAGLTGLRIDVQTSTDAAFTAPLTAFSSPTYTLADLQPGARYLLPDTIPVGANRRYLRLLYTVTGAATTGRITAGTTFARQTNRGIY